jgi:hypothetical protein
MPVRNELPATADGPGTHVMQFAQNIEASLHKTAYIFG